MSLVYFSYPGRRGNFSYCSIPRGFANIHKQPKSIMRNNEFFCLGNIIERLLIHPPKMRSCKYCKQNLDMRFGWARLHPWNIQHHGLKKRCKYFFFHVCIYLSYWKEWWCFLKKLESGCLHLSFICLGCSTQTQIGIGDLLQSVVNGCFKGPFLVQILLLM